MDAAVDQLEELAACWERVERFEEGGKVYFLIPDLVLPAGCEPKTADALLCPDTKDDYRFRVCFSQQIPSTQERNWNGQNVRIIERNWFSFSLKSDAINPRLVQMVNIYLGAIK